MDKIIQVHFDPEQEYQWGIEGLIQWDQGRKLEISGLDISSEIVEVHFSLDEYNGKAERMLGEVIDGVIHCDIPVFILEGPEHCCNDTYNAYAWVYVSDEESAETKRKIGFEIEARSEPNGYTKPEEVSFLQQLEAYINKKLDKSGYEPNKYLGTDEDGNVVTKESSSESSIEIDSELSDTSENPIENQAVAKEFGKIVGEMKAFAETGEITTKETTEETGSNLIDNVISVAKRQSTDDDNTITCDVDENGVLTIKGTCTASVYVFLTEELTERFPDGDYVVLSDNKDYSGSLNNYLQVGFFRYGHNAYNTYRYNGQVITSITNATARNELTLTRGDTTSFTYTKEEVAFGIALPAGTYNNVKIRVWLVKKGDNEEYSKYGTTQTTVEHTIKFITDTDLKLKVDHDLRFAVVSDIHYDYDDTEETNMGIDTKMMCLINSMNEEHHKKTLDFLLITGDIHDNCTLEKMHTFKKDYLWRFEMPVVVFPGNHDNFTDEVWRELTGYGRQFSLETDDFYFIFCDNFGDNLGKTWLSHWAAYYSSADEQAYIPCESTDDGALLIGIDISLEEVTPTMQGWNFIPTEGGYTKLAYVKDCDMYKSVSLEYVQSEVAKAGDKNIICISHQFLSTTEGDENGVKDYLNSLPNFIGYLEGHAHIYYDSCSATTGKWILNSGHFYKPNGGWDNVAANNYRGFRIIEIDNNELVTYKIQPTQNVGSAYEHEYDIVNRNVLATIERNPRADINLLKLSKDKEFVYKLDSLEEKIDTMFGSYVDEVAELIDENLALLGGVGNE